MHIKEVLEYHDFNKRPGEHSLFKYECTYDKKLLLVIKNVSWMCLQPS